MSLINWKSVFIDSYSMIWQTCDSDNVPGGFLEAPAAPATFPDLVTSAVTRTQLSASCSVYPHHFSCLHPRLFLVIECKTDKDFIICCGFPVIFAVLL